MNKAPFYDYSRDGITQGLLMKFLACREESKLFLQGWSPKRISSPALTFGLIGHKILEEVYDDIRTKKLKTCPSTNILRPYVRVAEKIWYRDNPNSSNESRKLLEASLCIAEATLPLYFKRWWAHDYNKIRWEKVEQLFKIPYVTQDGRKTFIRGRKDGLFKSKRLWLFESKFKSMINEDNLLDTLCFDFQVRLYLWAIRKVYKEDPAGVLYNIVRKTSLTKKASETLKQYGERITEDIKKRMDFYFIRYEIALLKKDFLAFEPELEQLIVDFMDWADGKSGHYKNTGSCITKYGRCQFLPICSTGSFALYTKRNVVFKELEDY